jgi:O-antigen/teichoic acid export membrane protein
MPRLKVLFSTAPAMMLARFAGAGAGFLAQLMLARLLAPEGLGMFFAASSLAAVLGLVATQGYPGIVQRFTTRYREKGRANLLRGFVAQVQREAGAVIAVFIALLAIAAVLLPAIDGDARVLIAATAVCTAAAGSLSIYPAFACADRRFGLGLLPETLLRPVIFLAVIGIVATTGVTLSPGIATAAFAGISAVLALAQFLVVRTTLSSGGPSPRNKLRRKWRAEGRPLLVVALFTTLFTDLVILLAAPFLGTQALAAFGVALKIAMLVGFAVQIAHQMALPDLAEAHQRRDSRQMANALLRSTLFPTALTLAVLVGVIAWGDHVLALFGPHYPVAKWGLTIMIAAQFIRAVAGPAPMLLTLAGKQWVNAAISVACCGVLLVANAALIPYLGLIGACLSVWLVVMIWAIASAGMLWRQLGIRADLAVGLRHAPGREFARLYAFATAGGSRAGAAKMP